MRVTFCGTASGLFMAERASSGVVIQHDGRTVMLDCGPGSVRCAVQAGIALPEIEAVVLSHLHADHVIDLASLVFQQAFGGWQLPAVYGPPGSEAVASAASALIDATALPRPLDGHAKTIEFSGDDEREIAGFRVRSAETPHAPGVPGNVRRFSAGGLVAVYTGDTSFNPDTIVPLADGADLLIHECYDEGALSRFTAGMPGETGEQYYQAVTGAHTDVMQAAAIARDAGVRRLALTHIPRYGSAAQLSQKAARVFNGEILIARDGLVVSL
jgi:ribonuclease BN (tRNA processing enzyme)